MKQEIFSVTSLVHYLKQSLDHDPSVQSILIKGEISNFTNHRSGHWYFTLKDVKAKISCVMFASYASRSKIVLKEGMKVIVSASVSMYEAGGSIQLYVTHVQADGLGDLFLQLERVKEQLRMEGLFAPERKKPLPDYPFSIGVITAKTGAAVQDILTTITRRWPLADVCVYPSLVQGSGAAKDIVKHCLEADEAHHDVILLARGGGAIEDLWCFNEELVARCVGNMQTVVVTGVGHETDTTLVDYVSDARAPTPTAAAELITPDIYEVKGSVELLRIRLQRTMRQRMQVERQHFDVVASHRYLKDPLSYMKDSQMNLSMHIHELSIIDRRIHKWKEELRTTSHQLAMQANTLKQRQKNLQVEKRNAVYYAMEHYKGNVKTSLKGNIQLLDAYSPLKILERGYTLAYQEDILLKSVDHIQEHEMIRVRMSDGILHAEVKKKEHM